MEIFAEEQKDTISFLKFLYSKRRTIILTVALSTIAVGVLTFFIPKRYNSFATVFPTESNKVLDILRDPKFGHDRHADHLLQMLESERLRDSIISRYNLIDYYEIDTAKADWQQTMSQKFVKDVNVRRTKYMSVVISATTKEPKLSAGIVNSMIDLVNDFRAQIFYANRKSALDAARKAYEEQAAIMESLRRQIYATKDTAKAQNILYNQVELSKERPLDVNFVNSPGLEKLIYDYRFALSRSEELKAAYNIAQEEFNKPMPTVFEVDRAKPSYKKASPSYTVNLAIAFFGSFVLVVIILFLAHKIREIKASFN